MSKKVANVATKTADPTWYRTSPIKLSSKRTGRPPIGRMKIKKGAVIEADKDIFDRLLSSASTSMFDDDEDHSQNEGSDGIIPTDIRRASYSGDSCLIPSLRVSYESRDGTIVNKNIGKIQRRVSFSDNLIQESTCSYSAILAESLNTTSNIDAIHSPHVNNKLQLQSLAVSTINTEEPEPFSQFFDESEYDDVNQSDQSKEEMDSGFRDENNSHENYSRGNSHGNSLGKLFMTENFSHQDGLDNADISMDEMNRQQSELSLSSTDYEECSDHMGKLLQNLSTYVAPPPVPVLTSVIKGERDEDEEFLVLLNYFENFTNSALGLSEKSNFEEDEENYCIPSFKDIYELDITTDILEEKIMEKVIKIICVCNYLCILTQIFYREIDGYISAF